MDITDFGNSQTKEEKKVTITLPVDKEIAETALSPIKNTPIYKASLTQWTIAGPKEYLGVSETTPKLDPGVYSQIRTNKGVIFKKIDIEIDSLLQIPDSLQSKILKEIEDFWEREEKFQHFGFLHRRGYLLYGPAGGGKTCLVQQVIANISKSGDVVMLCENPSTLIEAMQVFRQIEPTRRIVSIFEDIDAIIETHGENDILALLDGEHQINKVLNIASTNYPERLDKRLVARPRRFDRVIKIGMPTEIVRKFYLKDKTKGILKEEELDSWVKQSKGLSFAALAELVISVLCLGNTFKDTLEVLKSMDSKKVSSEEFETPIIGIRPTEKTIE